MVIPRTTLLAVLTLGLLSTAAAGVAAPASAPRVTIVADSVGGVLFWQREARDELGRGIDLRIEIRTCRRLVTEGCEYDGERPPSALEAIKALGPGLGDVVVVDIGYNDAPAGYPAALDRVMRALLDAGVDRVVWVTLRERRPSWAEINDAIRDGAKRWPEMRVGDWERESAGHDEWFADGIHMNWVGGASFGRFLRSLIVDACAAACAPGDAILTVRTDRLRTARAGARYTARLVASGGTPPYRWSVMGLPRRLRLRPDGGISGKAQTSGTYALAASVTDARGVENEGTVTLRVAPAR
jgi:hypothetical protein